MKSDITTELLEDASKELNKSIVDFDKRLNNLAPTALFQEKHTSGHLWWKKTYYTYWCYSERRMLQLYKDSIETVETVEGK